MREPGRSRDVLGDERGGMALFPEHRAIVWTESCLLGFSFLWSASVVLDAHSDGLFMVHRICCVRRIPALHVPRRNMSITSTNVKRIAVIGAGPSGLAAAK